MGATLPRATQLMASGMTVVGVVGVGVVLPPDGVPEPPASVELVVLRGACGLRPAFVARNSVFVMSANCE